MLVKIKSPSSSPSSSADNGPCLGSRKPKQPYEWLSYREVRVICPAGEKYRMALSAVTVGVFTSDKSDRTNTREQTCSFTSWATIHATSSRSHASYSCSSCPPPRSVNQTNQSLGAHAATKVKLGLVQSLTPAVPHNSSAKVFKKGGKKFKMRFTD